MAAFLQTQTESLKEFSILNSPSNTELSILMALLKNLEKLEFGAENLQANDGDWGFIREVAGEPNLKELRIHGEVKRMETLNSFVDQFKSEFERNFKVTLREISK